MHVALYITTSWTKILNNNIALRPADLRQSMANKTTIMAATLIHLCSSIQALTWLVENYLPGDQTAQVCT